MCTIACFYLPHFCLNILHLLNNQVTLQLSTWEKILSLWYDCWACWFWSDYHKGAQRIFFIFLTVTHDRPILQYNILNMCNPWSPPSCLWALWCWSRDRESRSTPRPTYSCRNEWYQRMICQARARARRACALRALGLLLADGTPTVGGGKTFWAVSRIFLRKQL